MGSSYGSFSSGGGSGRDRSPDSSRRSGGSQGWRVTVVDGYKHSKDWLLKRLVDACSGVNLGNISFRKAGKDETFIVQSDAAASALEDASNRITTKDGSRIIIKVAQAG